MVRKTETAKPTIAIFVILAIALLVAFVAPPVARVAIALIALPLTVMIVSSVVAPSDATMPPA
jgi:uncharacterized membrane protein YbaN (DUF454 family)